VPAPTGMMRSTLAGAVLVAFRSFLLIWPSYAVVGSAAFALAVVALVAPGGASRQSMLRGARGLAGYLGLVTACWCLLRTRSSN